MLSESLNINHKGPHREALKYVSVFTIVFRKLQINGG